MLNVDRLRSEICVRQEETQGKKSQLVHRGLSTVVVLAFCNAEPKHYISSSLLFKIVISLNLLQPTANYCLLPGIGYLVILFVVVRPDCRETSIGGHGLSPASPALSKSRPRLPAGRRQVGTNRRRSSGDKSLRTAQVQPCLSRAESCRKLVPSSPIYL